jgi:hypothetical protein
LTGEAVHLRIRSHFVSALVSATYWLLHPLRVPSCALYATQLITLLGVQPFFANSTPKSQAPACWSAALA